VNRFIIVMALRVGGSGAFVQSVTRLYGKDDVVRAWLASNPELVSLALLTYIGVSGLLHDAQRRTQELRYRGRLRGAAIRPPRILPRRKLKR